ncbi:MAG: hypothetical protein ACRDV9_14535 [Acidimicrobiia bacterium]
MTRAGWRKHSKLFTALLLVTAILLALAPSAVWAEYNVSRPGDFLGTFFDPNWPGTKLFGPLSILYEFVGVTGDCIEVKMVFVLRLKKGNQSFSFGGQRDSFTAPDGTTHPICMLEPTGQVIALVDFFKSTVVGSLFPGNAGAEANSRLKSLSNMTTRTVNPDPDPGGAFMVSSMDVELAVKE